MVEPRLRLSLLGAFELRMPDGRRIEVASRKTRALLAALALARDGERSREWVQTMLWGSRALPQAQASLRRELSNLRSLLAPFIDPETVLETGQQRIGLVIDRFEIDVREIADGRRPAQPIGAAAELLEGLSLPGEAGFEAWLAEQRGVIAAMLDDAATEAWRRSVRFRAAGEGDGAAAEGNGRSLRPAVAVLPPEGRGDSGAQAGAMAAADALSAALARHSTLNAVSVIDALGSPDAVRACSTRDLCREFGLSYLLAGRIAGDDAGPAIDWRLVDAVDFTQIWSGRTRGDPLGDQQARRTALHIDSAIERNERRRALREVRDLHDEAWLFWRANSLFRRWQPDALREAIELLELLVAARPQHGWGLSLLAFCHAVDCAAGWSPNPEAACRRARELIDRAGTALEDDPFALGYMAGALWTLGGEDARAAALAERALELHPGLPASLFWAGVIDLASGRTGQARARIGTALADNPESAVAPLLRAGMILCDLCEDRIAPEQCQPIFATIADMGGARLVLALARDARLIAVLSAALGVSPEPSRPAQDWSAQDAARA